MFARVVALTAGVAFPVGIVGASFRGRQWHCTSVGYRSAALYVGT